ncbi:MAG: 4-alpha-glucanotransferase [Clostridia bacterium]|nr:4-alpha-glucanotransferase [Clostridia bacterium]
MSKRTAGVLMHISSLPGPFGIGGFGESALRFVDFLKQTHFTYWQVLPFHPVDEVNSPYKSESAFAGNYLFIDPVLLQKDGLVSHMDVDACRYNGTPYTADYDFAREKKLQLLKTAYNNIGESEKKAVADFVKEHFWVEDFALFKAVKEFNGETPWWKWEQSQRDYKSCTENKEKYREQMNFWIFVQYIFFKQWQEIKAYANQNGIKILGDMPVYVSMDSADVWSNVEIFKIDKETFVPDEVAGVPPDYFSEDGQLWGNPLYDWDAMEKDGFSWWVHRLGEELSIYDTVRIDHFRGLASFWAVPFGSKTARNGEWKKGPGMKLFNAINKAYDNPSIIAEDLGVFGEDVVQLLEDTGFPGIRVIQFAFGGDASNEHLPHNYPKNVIACLGTHDNNTLLGWLYELSEGERKYALDYCSFDGGNWGEGGYKAPACRKVIETVWKSCADTAIIAFQDLCGFGNDARMNIPGIAELNWRIRTTQETIDNIDKEYFVKINSLYGRG